MPGALRNRTIAALAVFIAAASASGGRANTSGRARDVDARHAVKQFGRQVREETGYARSMTEHGRSCAGVRHQISSGTDSTGSSGCNTGSSGVSAASVNGTTCGE
jgi:hypothetical protein